MRLVGADELRATIAARVLGPSPPDHVGDVTLHPHQHDAVGRLRRMLDEHGGALLADDVGLGKTYVALALAQVHRVVLVIAPAAVRDHWRQCAIGAGVAITFHSMESLSRRGAPPVEPDFVIIDEAHHFRTQRTRRFAAGTRLCARAPVLLLSATPIQNRAADLRILLSLFLGSRAHALSNAEAAGLVMRRVAGDLGASGGRLPTVAPPRWPQQIDDVDCLDRILALSGCEVVGGTSLFRLARAADARERFARLLAAGFLVRPFDFDPTLLRFGLPRGRDQWRRLAAGLGTRA